MLTHGVTRPEYWDLSRISSPHAPCYYVGRCVHRRYLLDRDERRDPDGRRWNTYYLSAVHVRELPIPGQKYIRRDCCVTYFVESLPMRRKQCSSHQALRFLCRLNAAPRSVSCFRNFHVTPSAECSRTRPGLWSCIRCVAWIEGSCLCVKAV